MRERLQQLIDTNEFEFLKTMSEEDIWKFAFAILYVFSEHEERIGHCKDCKYFDYDSVAKVDRIPLIVAHEICNKWGDGCKTKEDGYCFLFEPQERSEG